MAVNEFSTAFSADFGSGPPSIGWNAADEYNTTVSGSNNTVATPGSGGGAIRSLTSRASGLWYAELTVTGTFDANAPVFGIASSNHSLLAAPGYGNPSDGVGIFLGDAQEVFNNNAYAIAQTPGVPVPSGSVISIAIDANNNRVYFLTPTYIADYGPSAWNANPNGNPVTGVGAINYSLTTAAFLMFYADTGSVVGTINTGTAPFARTPPAGYQAFDAGNISAYFGTTADTAATSDGPTVLGFVGALSDTAATSDDLSGQILVDTASTSDAFQTIAVGLTLADAAATSDSLPFTSAGGYSATVADTAATSDALTGQAVGAPIADVAATSDGFVEYTSTAATAALTDAAASSDQISLGGFAASLADTAASSDSLFTTTVTLNLQDVAATSDGFTSANPSLSVTDTAATSDGFVEFSSLSPYAPAYSTVYGSGYPVNASAVLSDAAASSDTTAFASLGLALADTTASSDAVVLTAGPSTAVSDQAATSDAWTAAFGTSISDTAATSAVFGLQFTNAAATSDSAATSDTIPFAAAAVASLADTAASSDTIAFVGISDYQQDAAATSDALSVINVGYTLADVTSTGDTLFAPAIGLTLADVEVTADAFVAIALSTFIADTAASSDSLIPSAALPASLADAAASSDAIGAAASLAGALSDTTASSDAQTSSAVAISVQSDTAASSDALTSTGIGYAILDTAASSDGFSGAALASAVQSDIVISSDSVLATAISVLPVNLSLGETQTLAALRTVLSALLPAGIEIIRSEINRVAEPAAADWVEMTPVGRVRLSTNVDTYVDYYPTPYGGRYATQPTQTTIQIDVHGPNSADNAQIISTMLRDGYACYAFWQINPAIQPLYAEDPRQLVFDNGENQMEFRWSVDVVLQVNPVVSVRQDFAGAVNVGLVDVDVAYPPI